MYTYWIEFTEILFPGLMSKAISTLPLLLGTAGAIRNIRAGRKRRYVRNLSGAIAAGVVTLGLLWSSLFGDNLSRSSTAGLIFLFAPIYAAFALLVGYLAGVILTRRSNRIVESKEANLPISARERTLVWIPILILATVVFGIVKYSITNNDLNIAERASHPETLRYVFDKAMAGNADAFGVALFLAQNPQAPADVLEKLSKSAEPQIRAFVATNPNTPTSVVASLREDCADYVRKAAQDRLKSVSPAGTAPQPTQNCVAAGRTH